MVEFAIVAPTFLLCLFAVLGAGLTAFYQHVLDDAVRDAARQVQIAGPAAASGSGFVSAVCDELGMLASNCKSTLTYAVQGSASGGTFAALAPKSLNGSGQYPNTFFSGNGFGPSMPVLVQAAYPIPFTLPFVGNLLTGTQTGSVIAAAAVRSEPYQ